MPKLTLLTTKNTKTEKSLPYGIATAVLHLLPAERSGYNVCPHSTPVCRQVCNQMGGRARFPHVGKARQRRTLELVRDPALFRMRLAADTWTFIHWCIKHGLTPALRFNAGSDLKWNSIWRKFEGSAIFYEYTKDHNWAFNSLRNPRPWEPHITLSRNETNWKHCDRYLYMGGTVAAVFDHKQPLPANYMGSPVINGDAHDMTWKAPPGSIIGLRFKPQTGIPTESSNFTIREENQDGK